MGTINKKQQRRQALKKQDRRKEERAKIAKFWQDVREESYLPYIQLEISFPDQDAPRNR